VAVLLLIVVAAAAGLLLLGGDSPFAPQATVPVVRGTVTAEVPAAGTVVSATSSSPAFAADGTVASVAVPVGAPVRIGDVLATLDDGTARARSTAAAATLAADQRAIATDRVGVTGADQALAATVLRAPQDGTVTDVAARVGDRVTASSPPAVRIADLTALVVQVGIGPRDVAGMAAGQDATVAVDGAPATGGQVAEVAPAPGPDGRYAVVVNASLPPTARIGQPVDVVVVVARHTDVLVVPAAAVQRSAATPPGTGTVLVSAPDGVRPRTVTVGLAGPEGVEVLDGVVAGDLVVVPDATLPRAQLTAS
jgi:multidrug efflux pump subunit AcrA (membrane-fusion protein)